MCGIVGLMNAPTTPSLDAAERTKIVGLANELKALTESADAPTLQERLEQLGKWISPLPNFATSFALSSDPMLPGEIEILLMALDATQKAVDHGQTHADGFVELETWNRLGHLTRDLHWRLKEDLMGTQQELLKLFAPPWKEVEQHTVRSYWNIEFILRSLNRLEIRGRDSSGISVLVHFASEADISSFTQAMEEQSLLPEWQARTAIKGLDTLAICGRDEMPERRTISFLYKVASEIGSIGQNIQDLREQIHNDKILRLALTQTGAIGTPMAHTRWASNGIINIYNAHPQGNDTQGMSANETRLFAALNGDIDNFSELLDAYRRRTGRDVPIGVTTDAKIIPLLVEERYQECGDLREAFRRCLQEFRGSFAISIHHLDHPDKVWLGIGGSGQSLYVGVHPQAVFFASELYGVVEGTNQFVKLDGEREREPGNPSTTGQMLEISKEHVGTSQPFRAWSFDGVALDQDHLPIKEAQITTRDINIGGYPHFFLKEISESVDSVRKTLHGRFFLQEGQQPGFSFNFDEATVPSSIAEKLKRKEINKIYCIGQGTAAIAAMGVAGAMRQSLSEDIVIQATKASELSGHMLGDNMEDTLIIAVSQSGTTTDTNRTVDLARQRGAPILAILNRRNSDLAFKADGVIFTSDGRDVEMSVASTKAFYSQVTAGVLLGLYLGYGSEMLDATTVHEGLKELVSLPRVMARVLAQGEKVKQVAFEHALTKRYWAVVGSGFNQIASHEIRIKLSELCYKSMSCDTIEDKKHIDLSAEPLMLVCAAGLDEANLSDTVKEVAIFKAHSSTPIVIASRGADRFAPYAAAVFEVPDLSPHLSPILTTMIGHLFGYHAACAIDQQGIKLRRVRQELLQLLPSEDAPDRELTEHLGADSHFSQNLLALLKTMQAPQMNSALEVDTAVRLALGGQRLLFSLLNQQALLPNGHKADSPHDLAQELLLQLTDAIRELSRPIDAIKHQAKTVTVGISRPTPTLKGVIGKVFEELQISPTSVLWRNLSYLIATEKLVEDAPGATLYHVSGLEADGQPNNKSRIFKEAAIGVAANLPSRTSTDSTLRGSKWLALKKNSVSIGVGRTDGRHIAIIPLRASSQQEARILLLHLEYNEQATLQDRLHLLRTRGPVYDQFRAAVTELGLQWNDQLLMQAPVEILFDDAPDRFVNHLAGMVGRFDSWTGLEGL